MGVTRNPPQDTSAPTSEVSEVTKRVQVTDDLVLQSLREIEQQLKIANVHNELVTGDNITTKDVGSN